tara:strand:+ start:938 stop:1153 length:216 start_codon:yes stop_codon:yes gene_type:complete
MFKQLTKKWLGLTELEEEVTAMQEQVNELDYTVGDKADRDDVDNVEGELNNVASNVDDIIIRLDDLEKENA